MTTSGTGTFRVTVTRVDGDHPTGKRHEIDVVAGSWIGALEAAVATPELFRYVKKEEA